MAYQGLLVGNADPRLRIRTVPGLPYIWDLAFSAPEVVWAISDGGVLLNSIDNGQHWSKTALTSDHRRLSRVVFIDSSNGWVVGDEGAIYHTENGGLTWDKQNGWTDLHLRRVQFVDTRHGWITGSRNVSDSYPPDWRNILLGTDDGGKTWEWLSAGEGLGFRDIHFVNMSYGWGIDSSGSILHTSDGGKTWTIQRRGGQTPLTRIFFVNDREGWVVGDGILHTHDGGLTWKYQLTRNQPEQILIEGVAFSDSQHGWAFKRMEILSTDDGGKSWKTVFRRPIIPESAQTRIPR